VEQIPLTLTVAPFFIFPPPPLHLMQFLDSFWGYLHLSPPPPQEPSVFEPKRMPQEPVKEPLPVEDEQLGVEEMFMEVMEDIIEEPGDTISDDKVVFLEAVAAPKRRRRARQLRDDDDEYVVESVVDRRYFHGVEHFLVEWSGYGPEENSWELGHEKRVEIPDAISLYFYINGIADDGIMILRSRDEEIVEDRQPGERPFLARAAKRPRFS
jgi:hypothetical protein